MSGGGLNYLQNQDLEQLSVNDDLADAIAYLKKERLGDEAATYSQYLKRLLECAKTIAEELSPVWQAIDKCLSHDWGADDLNNALIAFSKNNNLSSITLPKLENLSPIYTATTMLKGQEPDLALSDLIAQNTAALHKIQHKIILTDSLDELQMLAKTFDLLVDARNKLIAIALQ